MSGKRNKGANGHAIRVLLVDDDERCCNAIADVLKSAGHRVHIATDPAVVVHTHKRGQYDMAIVDLNMPGMTGMDLLAWLDEHDAALIKTILSGDHNFESAQTGMIRGYRGFFTKPIVPNEMLSKFDQIARNAGLISDPEKKIKCEIGRRIRARREEQHLTLSELHNRVDLSTAQLSHIELGNSSPSLRALIRICGALNTTISEITEGLR